MPEREGVSVAEAGTMKNLRTSMKRRLEKRGLPTPTVNYRVVEEMWNRAKAIEDP